MKQKRARLESLLYIIAGFSFLTLLTNIYMDITQGISVSLIFWVLIIISVFIRWRYILWIFPIISASNLVLYLWSLSDLGSPGAYELKAVLLSVFGSITIILGLIAWVWWMIESYKKDPAKYFP